MGNDFTSATVLAVRELYRTNENARLLFDWAAQRERDAKETSIERISQVIRSTRGEAVALARELEGAECGEFVVGRRGSKSRLVWSYSPISLGQTASGEDDRLEGISNPVSEDEEGEEAGEFDEYLEIDDSSVKIFKLTLDEAKRGLANNFGVPLANIEIIIKS
jgi:hypothetical protein